MGAAMSTDVRRFAARAVAIELDEADAEPLGEMHEEEVLRLTHISEANTRRAHALIRRLAKDALEALDAANSAVVTDDDLLGCARWVGRRDRQRADVAEWRPIREAPVAEMANWLKANTATDGEHRARTAIIETYKRCQRKVLESFLATHSE